MHQKLLAAGLCPDPLGQLKRISIAPLAAAKWEGTENEEWINRGKRKKG